MTGVVPLWRGSDGLDHFWEPLGGDKYAIHTRQADNTVEGILDRNKAMANENAGWSTGGGKMMRRVGSIPLIIVHKWLVEEGWNALDPNYSDKLDQKMNDPDWKWLRTAEWRV